MVISLPRPPVKRAASPLPVYDSCVIFSLGHCQFCGYFPKASEVDRSSDVLTLYHCPMCGFPVEFMAIMAFISRFEEQMESDSQLLDSFGSPPGAVSGPERALQ